MRTIERIIHLVGRFAVGFGIGLALMCAFVIVTTDIGLDARRSREPVVQLDPVVVTISAERYAVLVAELQGRPPLARTPNHGESEG